MNLKKEEGTVGHLWYIIPHYSSDIYWRKIAQWICQIISLGMSTKNLNVEIWLRVLVPIQNINVSERVVDHRIDRKVPTKMYKLFNY